MNFNEDEIEKKIQRIFTFLEPILPNFYFCQIFQILANFNVKNIESSSQ